MMMEEFGGQKCISQHGWIFSQETYVLMGVANREVLVADHIEVAKGGHKTRQFSGQGISKFFHSVVPLPPKPQKISGRYLVRDLKNMVV